MGEFPKWLKHPNATDAVLSQGAVGGSLFGGSRYAGVGKPGQFPPVVVHNRDDEAWYVSKGYEAGAYDQAAVDRQRIAPLPNGYREQEYPRFEADGSVTLDPNPPPVENYEYPKYVPGPNGDEVARNAEEERAILARAGREPEVRRKTMEMTEEEYAAFQAWRAVKEEPAKTPQQISDETLTVLQDSLMAAARPVAPEIVKRVDRDLAAYYEEEDKKRQTMSRERDGITAETRMPRPLPGRAGVTPSRGTPEQLELIDLCRAAGVRGDTRWSVRRLRAMLEAATAPPTKETLVKRVTRTKSKRKRRTKAQMLAARIAAEAAKKEKADDTRRDGDDQRGDEAVA